MNRTKVGATIKKVRKESNLSQVVVANYLNISQGTLSKIENGIGDMNASEFLVFLELSGMSSNEFIGVMYA